MSLSFSHRWVYGIFVISCLLLTMLLIVGIILAIFMFPRAVEISLISYNQTDDYVNFKLHPNVTTMPAKDNVSEVTLIIDVSVLVKPVIVSFSYYSLKSQFVIIISSRYTSVRLISPLCILPVLSVTRLHHLKQQQLMSEERRS